MRDILQSGRRRGKTRRLFEGISLIAPKRQPGACLQLARSPRSAAVARRFVEEKLRDYTLPAEAVENTKLVASELVTNAFKHGDGSIEMCLTLPGDYVRVEVIDQGTRNVPCVREQPADETGGWGLQIVDRLAHQWGVFEGTTHVWADLPLTG